MTMRAPPCSKRESLECGLWSEDDMLDETYASQVASGASEIRGKRDPL